ncbi:hypothetical protein RF11_01976 [Thelohanellus kitauei]|uniref:Uncharacterized protein n=1 Tax=Thelohanellus kitauei TaxID=669202 RepID=A0A0C2MUY3_THEKT|nr:hypothetical protein RF11_01976 [Thelohanellus kitauei]
MESGQIVQDFALNVKRVTGPEGDEQRLGLEWMEKFQDSEQALDICYEILKSAIDDDVQLHSVKVIENKKIYNFLLEFLKKSPNCDVAKQVWNISLSKMINDIISVMAQPSNGCGDSIDDLYPQETAIIFMRELLVDRKIFDDPEYTYFRSKILDESESMDKTIVNFH